MAATEYDIREIRLEVLEAAERIEPFIRETPLEFSHYLSSAGGCEVFLKLENVQITGSFKLRGAINKLLTLSPEERGRGVVTASSGNHAAAVAHSMRELGIDGVIYLPEYAPESKIESLRFYGVELRIHGDDCLKTERRAREEARASCMVYIPPYNDLKIVAGQGTVALEIERRLDELDAVLVPVGGGGLISGIAAYLKPERAEVEIIGCQPENSAVMYESVKAGRILDIESRPTLSDGTAGGIEEGSITFDICRACVSDFVVVSEDEIAEAVRLMIERHHMLVEGAAALPVASFLKSWERFRNRRVALIISGAKLSIDALRRVLALQ